MVHNEPAQSPNDESNSISSFPALTTETAAPQVQEHPYAQLGFDGDGAHGDGGSESWETEPEDEEEEDEPTDKLFRDMQATDKLHSLNPYKSALNLSHVDSCVVLEDLAFPPEQRATREKFQYRILKNSPFSMGLFTSVTPDSSLASLPTYATSRLAESGTDRRSVLLAHIVVTLTNNPTVQDEDMALPPDWQLVKPVAAPHLGHKPAGRTVALHSLAVLPELKGQRIGSTLLKSFVQIAKDSGVVDRVSLITYERLVTWYERLGFTCLGRSSAQHGGEEWWDMVIEFDKDEGSDVS